MNFGFNSNGQRTGELTVDQFATLFLDLRTVSGRKLGSFTYLCGECHRGTGPKPMLAIGPQAKPTPSVYMESVNRRPPGKPMARCYDY